MPAALLASMSVSFSLDTISSDRSTELEQSLHLRIT